ncbi:MAG: hypothetical protein U0401_12005 [Anaerolineae bacterium]
MAAVAFRPAFLPSVARVNWYWYFDHGVGGHLPTVRPLTILAAMLAAAIVGGLYAWLAAFFQFKPICTAAHYVPAAQLSGSLLPRIWSPYPFRIFSGMPQSYLTSADFTLTAHHEGSRLHAGLFITLAAGTVSRLGHASHRAGL